MSYNGEIWESDSMAMSELEKHFIAIGGWISTKFQLHMNSLTNSVKKRTINVGEIWNCDLGFNIGDEKNKKRPVLVISNNRINQSGKVIVLFMTDALGKVDTVKNFPKQNSWYLLFSTTTDNDMMFKAGRRIPKNKIAYDCLHKDTIVQCEEIRSVSKSRFDSMIMGTIDPNDLKIIKAKLKTVFEIL